MDCSTTQVKLFTVRGVYIALRTEVAKRLFGGNMKKTYKLAIVCLSLLLVGSILGATVFASAATANDYVSAYRSDASSARDALTRANELNQKIVEEGIVLLKNNDNALPIATGTRVSVFRQKLRQSVLRRWRICQWCRW